MLFRRALYKKKIVDVSNAEGKVEEDKTEKTFHRRGLGAAPLRRNQNVRRPGALRLKHSGGTAKKVSPQRRKEREEKFLLQRQNSDRLQCGERGDQETVSSREIL